jgi:hypothetical protein
MKLHGQVLNLPPNPSEHIDGARLPLLFAAMTDNFY